MAFDYTNLYPDTSGNGGFTKTWNYTTVGDSIAVCSASGYFNKVASRLGIGDNIFVAVVDAFDKTRTTLVDSAVLSVNGIASGIVTTQVFVASNTAAAIAAVAASDALKAPIASPTFSGTPAAPTAAPGTNTTQVASTAFTIAEILARVASLDVAVFKGVIDCSANPNYPAADAGATYRISVAGKIGGASGTNVEAGDMMMCITDGSASGTQAAVGANWDIVQANLDGAVIGPASATSGNVASFNGATGKLLQNSSNPAAALPTAVGQLPGTATNDSASAGNVGQLITSNIPNASAVSLTTGVAANITSVSLTAGDWDVWGTTYGKPAGTSTTAFIQAALTTSSATMPSDASILTATAQVWMPNTSGTGGATAGGSMILSVSPVAYSFSATTSVFLVMAVTFGVSTYAGYGTIWARRRR